MFGLMECDGVGWNGMVNNYVPLFGFTKNEWNGMEHNGIIPSHSIKFCNFPQFWGVSNGIELYNYIITNFTPIFTTLDLLLRYLILTINVKKR